MIGSLRGVLLERWGECEVLVEVGGIGYRVTVTAGTSAGMGEVGSEVFVYVTHHVREDSETLFGFASRDERLCFEALLGAHGVGPSLAMAILAVHSPASLQRVLLDDDLDSLCLVPGVGKKTASRLLIELKSRLDIPELALAPSMQGSGPDLRSGTPSVISDVRIALASLGYATDEITEVLRGLPDGDDSAEVLRMALQQLAAV